MEAFEIAAGKLTVTRLGNPMPCIELTFSPAGFKALVHVGAIEDLVKALQRAEAGTSPGHYGSVAAGIKSPLATQCPDRSGD